MKKILSIALIAMMILSCFSFVTFAEDYDSTWYITTDKETYYAGDYMAVTFINSKLLSNDFYKGCIHITFDKGVLEYATDKTALEAAGFQPLYVPGDILPRGVTTGVNTESDGEYICQLTSDSGYPLGEDEEIYTLYFKIKEDIKGINELNFNWVLKDTIDDPAFDNSSYAGYWDTSNVSYLYNMAFENKTVKIVGSELALENEYLPMAYVNVSENDLNETNINGTIVNITTNYAVAFGKVAARKADVTRTKAGFILSTTNENMTVDNLALKNFEAINVSSENIFGGLFYGPGLEAGETYYVMPYVTYSDKTLYAQNPVSFTMPE